jgi:DNA polymerase III delta prime subunit
MNDPPSSRDIQRWYPQRWEEIAGNAGMIRTWWNFLTYGISNALFTGPNRTGKTRTISLGIKALLCTNRTEALNPCGRCQTCRLVDEGRCSHTGIFSALCESEYEFLPIDCWNVTKQYLQSLWEVIDLDSDRSVIYLDEVAALGRRDLEPYVLKPIDESRAVWIASAITVRRSNRKGKARYTEGLSIPIQGRFGIKVGTSLPSVTELTTWIQDRCRDWKIEILDSNETVPLMIKRTGGRVGYVIHFLSAAAAQGRRIDPDMVIRFNLGPQD